MLDLRPQRLARPEQVLLAHKFVERLRTHPVRQRPARLRFFLRLDCLK